MEAANLRMRRPNLRGARSFLTWWLCALRGMLPERLRSTLWPQGERLVVELAGRWARLSRASEHEVVDLGEFQLGEDDEALSEVIRPQMEVVRTGVLRLVQSMGLQRDLSLPLAAEENLREVLAFEMDRQTPFPPEQVYYDFRVLERDTKEKVLQVRLVVVPRKTLDAALKRLARVGFEPAVVNVADQEPDINLLPADQRPSESKVPRLANIALSAVAVMLLVAAVALPLLQKRETIKALRPMLERARAEAEQAQQLRQHIDVLDEQMRFLVDRKRGTPLFLAVLGELTELLPDDTWVTRLEVKGKEVQIHGQSPSAANLISVIDASPMFSDVRFRSPVTQDPRSDAERFHLSATIRPKGET